jgi:hypothetical protein
LRLQRIDDLVGPNPTAHELMAATREADRRMGELVGCIREQETSR